MSDELLDIADSLQVESEITVRNLSKREIDVRLAPFDVAIETVNGPEVIVRGAFADVNPSKVLLMGLEHEVHLGVGQDGKVVPTRRPAGKAIHIEEREDGGYATFRVSKTPSGDEILALADDGVVSGISVEMGRNWRYRTAMQNGRRTNFVEFADLRAVAPTYQPAYADAQVLAVRSHKEDAPVAAEEKKAPDAGAPADEPKEQELPAARAVDTSAFENSISTSLASLAEKFSERVEKLEENARMAFTIPNGKDDAPPVTRGEWAQYAMKILSGERIPDQQFRLVAEIISSDNAGVVPDAYISDIIGVIDRNRPFLQSTRRLNTPASGLQMVVPKIGTRPTTGVQAAEKDELTSTTSTITTESFDMVTIGGVGDLSLQLLKRSDPSFLELYLDLLGEAYAIDAEDEATDALIEAINDGGPEPATALDPEALALGAAYQTSFDAIRRPPDTIWMSTEAVAGFINAKASGTNAPLYSTINADFSAAGGVGGTISGLRVVHVPALNNKGAYAIVGPSTGFAWAEDGTYTLQVDVPSKAGRDVALVGMLWFAPWYPEAFSLFNVAS